jgi:hypothetical protein
VSRETWQWFGQAGHFVAADRCRFHLHTHVGPFCVSTVGAFFVHDDDRGPTAIGAPDRTYETMVFRLDKDGETDGSDIDMSPYNDLDAANAGHIAMCERWAARR